MEDAIKNIKLDNDWVYHELKVQGKKLENVLLGTVDINKKLRLYEKNVNKEIEDILE